MHNKISFFLIILINFFSIELAQQVNVSTIRLSSPLSLDGLIVANDGTLYGADGYNGSRIYKISMDGSFEVFASGLNGPIDMDFDNKGNLYVTTFNDRGVFKITPSGEISKFASVNIGPSGIVINRITGDVFVSHFGLQPYSGNSINKIDSAGIGKAFVTDTQLRSPVSLAIDDEANLYTPNIGDSKLFKINQDGEISLLSSLPVSSAIYNIGHIEFANNKLYITGNTGKHYLYEVDLNGNYKIIAGNGIPGNTDGEGLTAQFNGPNGIAASVTGDTLFISELNNPYTIRVVTLNSVTDNEENQQQGIKLNLMQNYPNPFNPSTTINFQLASAGQSRVAIYNSLGQEIVELLNGYFPTGIHNVTWNGTDNNGTKVSSGIYFYSLNTQGRIITRKMILNK